MRNVEKTFKNIRKGISIRYDLTAGEIEQIFRIASNEDCRDAAMFRAICDSFAFGYSAGLKAAKVDGIEGEA